jgi:hypothetical protein
MLVLLHFGVVRAAGSGQQEQEDDDDDERSESDVHGAFSFVDGGPLPMDYPVTRGLCTDVRLP